MGIGEIHEGGTLRMQRAEVKRTGAQYHFGTGYAESVRSEPPHPDSSRRAYRKLLKMQPKPDSRMVTRLPVTARGARPRVVRRESGREGAHLLSNRLVPTSL